MDKERKKMILRFTSLCLREAQGQISAEELQEKSKLLADLGMSAEEIINSAREILVG